MNTRRTFKKCTFLSKYVCDDMGLMCSMYTNIYIYSICHKQKNDDRDDDNDMIYIFIQDSA